MDKNEYYLPAMEVHVSTRPGFDKMIFHARLGPSRKDPLVYEEIYVSTQLEALSETKAREALLDRLWNSIKAAMLQHYAACTPVVPLQVSIGPSSKSQEGL